jgi:hypothetical protein
MKESLRKRSDTKILQPQTNSHGDPRTQGRWSHLEHEKFIQGKVLIIYLYSLEYLQT